MKRNLLLCLGLCLSLGWMNQGWAATPSKPTPTSSATGDYSLVAGPSIAWLKAKKKAAKKESKGRYQMMIEYMMIMKVKLRLLPNGKVKVRQTVEKEVTHAKGTWAQKGKKVTFKTQDIGKKKVDHYSCSVVKGGLSCKEKGTPIPMFLKKQKAKAKAPAARRKAAPKPPARRPTTKKSKSSAQKAAGKYHYVSGPSVKWLKAKIKKAPKKRRGYLKMMVQFFKLMTLVVDLKSNGQVTFLHTIEKDINRAKGTWTQKGKTIKIKARDLGKKKIDHYTCTVVPGGISCIELGGDPVPLLLKKK